MDQELLLWINQSWAHPWLDVLMHRVSLRTGFGVPVALLILVYCAYRYGADGVKLWLWAVLAVAAGDAIGATIKALASQARPCFDLYELVRQVGRPPGTPCGSNLTGMPSNHSLDFFTMATLITFITRSRALMCGLFPVALAVALSRIYLGKHYPSQVMVGALIGITVGLVMAWLAVKYFEFAARVRND